MLAISFKTKGYSKTDDRTYNASNIDTQFKKVCNICKDNSTTNHTIQYNPLKTMRHTDNTSQKIKQASFIRRSQTNSISQTEAIQFRFRNL
jgi:hypothetical protein